MAIVCRLWKSGGLQRNRSGGDRYRLTTMWSTRATREADHIRFGLSWRIPGGFSTATEMSLRSAGRRLVEKPLCIRMTMIIPFQEDPMFTMHKELSQVGESGSVFEPVTPDCVWLAVRRYARQSGETTETSAMFRFRRLKVKPKSSKRHSKVTPSGQGGTPCID